MRLINLVKPMAIKITILILVFFSNCGLLAQENPSEEVTAQVKNGQFDISAGIDSRLNPIIRLEYDRNGSNSRKNIFLAVSNRRSYSSSVLKIDSLFSTCAVDRFLFSNTTAFTVGMTKYRKEKNFGTTGYYSSVGLTYIHEHFYTGRERQPINGHIFGSFNYKYFVSKRLYIHGAVDLIIGFSYLKEINQDPLTSLLFLPDFDGNLNFRAGYLF